MMSAFTSVPTAAPQANLRRKTSITFRMVNLAVGIASSPLSDKKEEVYRYTQPACSYGLQHEFITPHCPQRHVSAIYPMRTILVGLNP